MRVLRYVGFSLAGLLAASALLWIIGRQPTFQFFGALLYRVNTPEKVVALTFDDGPSPENTEDVLKILRENSVKATFFLVGKNIERFPELARKVVSEGHQAANHSYSHRRMLLQSTAFCRDEIEKTDSLIRDVGYTEEIVFRPPFGKKLFSLPLALRELNKLSVTWDVEPEDTETQDATLLQKRVLDHAKPGSIILFHDGNARKEGTLAALPVIIRELRSQGYGFLTVNDLRKRAVN